MNADRRGYGTYWPNDPLRWTGRQRTRKLLTALAIALALPAAAGAESWETAPIRPEGGQYVSPPFTPLALAANAVSCLGRAYDLTAAVPVPTVAGRPLLLEAAFTLEGMPLTSPTPTWTVKTPAVAIAERTWLAGPLRLALRQTIEYDGFVTSDLTLAPAEGVARISDLALRLKHRPETSTL
ncbi:MAG: hypothetical protein FJ279_23850, partial [Planctomycetes bacterium]|nr:hypothetical protein [Planctomycetota bacterium]